MTDIAKTIARAIMDDIERRKLCHEHITLDGLETVIWREMVCDHLPTVDEEALNPKLHPTDKET